MFLKSFEQPLCVSQIVPAPDFHHVAFYLAQNLVDHIARLACPLRLTVTVVTNERETPHRVFQKALRADSRN